MVVSLSAIALLSSCGEERPPPESEPVVQPARQTSAFRPENTLTSVAALQGEYRVAGIDDAPLDAPFGIALSIAGPVLSFQPVCAGFVWTIGISQDGRLDLVRNPDFGPERQSDGSFAICDVEVAPELYQLGQALDHVSLARQTPDGGLLLSGDGRSVTLFSQ